MNHPPAPRPPDPVRVVVDDVPDLCERVREAARRAHRSERVVELVEPAVAVGDHAARARLARRLDEALATARGAAPGVQVRIGAPVRLPRPRPAP